MLTRVEVLRQSIEKVVKILAHSDIRVTQQGSEAYVSHLGNNKVNRINIPAIPDDASDEFILALQGFIDHEVSHFLHSDFDLLLKSSNAGSFIGQLHNIVEDTYIERAMEGYLKGSGENLDNTRQFFLDDFTEKNLKEALKDGEDPTGILMVPAFRAWGGQKIMQEYMADKWDLIKGFTDVMGQDLIDQVLACKNTQDTYDLTLEIAKRCAEPPEMPPPPQAGDNSESDDDDDDDDGESDENSDPDQKPEKDEPEKDEPEKDDESEGEGKSDEEAGESDESEDDSNDDGDSDEDDSDDDGDSDEDDSNDDGDSDEDESESDGSKDEGDESDEGDDDSDEGESDDGDSDEGESDDGDSDEGDSDEGESDEGESDDGDPEGDKPEDSDDGEPDDDSTKATPDVVEIDAFDLEAAMEKSQDFDQACELIINNLAKNEASSSSYLPYTTDYDKVELWDSGFSPADQQISNLVSRMEERVDAMMGPIKNALVRAIKAKSNARWQSGRRSGKVNGRSLSRLAIGKQHPNLSNDRIFKRKEVTVTDDVAISLLVDCSGSMGRSRGYNANVKSVVAMDAAYAFSSVLTELNIANEVLGFTTGDYPDKVESELEADPLDWSREGSLYMPIFKNFEGKLDATAKGRLAGYPMYGRMLGNADGECVLIAARRLSARRESAKLMIVFSDGQPIARGNRGEIYKHLKTATAAVEKSGISLVGIGINSNKVREFYKNHVVLHNIAGLGGTVLTQIKDTIMGAIHS